MGYLYILGTITLTVYGQLILKWQVSLAGSLPDGLQEKLFFLFRLVINPWVISSLLAAFLAFLCWLAALTKFELNYAYPFMSLSFILVLLLSGVFLNESISMNKIAGVVLILIGIAIGSKT